MPDIINLASGSRGNATLVTTSRGGVLVDAGISASELNKRLLSTGKDVRAVLVTHEHVDHVRGLAAFCKEKNVPALVHEKVAPVLVERYGLAPELVTEFGDTQFELDDMLVTPFRTPHDTIYPVGFVIRDENGTAGVATDLIRLSVGIENVEDLIADLQQALDRI